MHIQMAWKVDCRSVLHTEFEHSKKRKEYLKLQGDGRNNNVASVCTELNPFAPGDFAEKRVLKLVEWFSGHCRAIKS